MSSSNKKSEKESTKVALSETEQQVIIVEEIQRFIKLAKERGALMVEELNELLAPEIIAAPVLDHFMQALEINGVIITDGSEIKKDQEEEEGRLFEADNSGEL